MPFTDTLLKRIITIEREKLICVNLTVRFVFEKLIFEAHLKPLELLIFFMKAIIQVFKIHPASLFYFWFVWFNCYFAMVFIELCQEKQAQMLALRRELFLWFLIKIINIFSYTLIKVERLKFSLNFLMRKHFCQIVSSIKFGFVLWLNCNSNLLLYLS